MASPAAGTAAGAARCPTAITLRPNASSLESFAANEVRRYVYLRTGRLLPVKQGGGHRNAGIVVTRRDPQWCGNLGANLQPQQFTLQTTTTNGETTWWVVGGDEIGTLYGAYRFAEKLGVRFSLDDDAVPDERLAGAWPDLTETGRPRFALRGLQPFHDFSVGPDWWNLHDYQGVLQQMAKLRLNFLGLHTYPSWNPSAGPEANVWIGLPEDVDEKGNVSFAYRAGVVTTRRGWEVKPFPTGEYASGGGLLFESDDYGPDFMLDCLDWPKTPQAAAAMFNRYGDMQREMFGQARRLGIKTCMGTELPLGVPPELTERLARKGMKPDDSAVIDRLYQGTMLRLMRKSPVDYFWFWAPEIWLGAEPGCAGWEVTSRANVERDLRAAQAAAQAVKAPFGFATSGWRLGTRDDALWFAKRTPANWVASSINTSGGCDPVEKAYGAMPDRPKWVIGWAEDDNTAGAHCCTCWDLQFAVERMIANATDAARYGCEGMMAIHWRTAAIAPTISALARAGWEYEGTDTTESNNFGAVGKTPDMAAFWANWGSGMFGGEAGAQVGLAMRKFDGSHQGINALVGGGAATTDARIAELFSPLDEMVALRSRITGTANLERLDYWLNLIGATRSRVQTWVLAARLGEKLKEVQTLAEGDARRDFTRAQILPVRMAIARRYEELIAALVACAKSPGEIGTITSIESGMRARIVSAHDAAIENLLGEPLPPAAKLSTAYRSAPRIFVSARCSQTSAGKPQEIRAFVASAQPCNGVSLHWRRLGEGGFREVVATHRSRQAYRVSLPAQPAGAVEYYLEALLANGHKVSWPSTAPTINQTVVAW